MDINEENVLVSIKNVYHEVITTFTGISDALINVKCIFPVLWGVILDYEKEKNQDLLDSYQEELINFQTNYDTLQSKTKWLQKDLFFLISGINKKVTLEKSSTSKEEIKDVMEKLTTLKNDVQTFLKTHLFNLNTIMRFLEKKPQLILATEIENVKTKRDTYITQIDDSLKLVNGIRSFAKTQLGK